MARPNAQSVARSSLTRIKGPKRLGRQAAKPDSIILKSAAAARRATVLEMREEPPPTPAENPTPAPSASR